MALHTIDIPDGSELERLTNSWNNSRNAARILEGNPILTFEQDLLELVKDTSVVCEPSYGKDLKAFSSSKQDDLRKQLADEVTAKALELKNTILG